MSSLKKKGADLVERRRQQQSRAVASWLAEFLWRVRAGYE